MPADRPTKDPAEPADWPLDQPFQVATLKRGRDTAFDVHPRAADRARVADFLGLLSLSEFRLRGTLCPAPRGGWRLEGRLTATLEQPCVATLDPVPARVDSEISRDFVPEEAATGATLDLDADADEDWDSFTDIIDPAHVAVEELALALDPWPRAAGVDAVETLAGPPGTDPLDDDAVKPFAGLAALKARMEENGQ